MHPYDFAIAGGGIAGTTLAYYLSLACPEKKIIIIDQQAQSDKAIGFWTNEEFPFPEVIAKTWQFTKINTPAGFRILKLQNYHFYLFYHHSYIAHLNTLCKKNKNITYRKARITKFSQKENIVHIFTDTNTVSPISAQWLFDSTMLSGALPHKMVLEGAEIEIITSIDRFNPKMFTFFDIRKQRNELSLFYILPISKNRAIIESAYFLHAAEPSTADKDLYSDLHNYIRDALGIFEYKTLRCQRGRIPLATTPIERRNGHIIRIGANAGLVKPSTGFGFMRILKDSQRLAKLISTYDEAARKEIRIPPISSKFYQVADAAVVNMMLHNADDVRKLFTTMFMKMDPDRMFTFLDEKNSLQENRDLMWQVKNPRLVWEFMKSLVYYR